MGVSTLVPNGNGSQTGTWGGSGSPGYSYTEIDEGTTTPNDVDFVFCSTDSTYIFYLLSDTDAAFYEATSVLLKFRANNASKGTPRKYATAQIFKADETTALTGTGDVSGTSTSASTLSVPLTITGATDKTSWDGARIKITTNSGGTGAPNLYALQVEVTFNTAPTITSANVDRSTVGRGLVRGLARGVNRIWIPPKRQIFVPAFCLRG